MTSTTVWEKNVLTTHVQENSNKFIALEEENHTLRIELHTLQEQNQRLSVVESTPQQQDPSFGF